MAIFKCKKCGKISSVSKFRTYYKGGKKININLEDKKEIICEDCKEHMEFIPDEGNFQSSYSQQFHLNTKQYSL